MTRLRTLVCVVVLVSAAIGVLATQDQDSVCFLFRHVSFMHSFTHISHHQYHSSFTVESIAIINIIIPWWRFSNTSRSCVLSAIRMSRLCLHGIDSFGHGSTMDLERGSFLSFSISLSLSRSSSLFLSFVSYVSIELVCGEWQDPRAAPIARVRIFPQQPAQQPAQQQNNNPPPPLAAPSLPIQIGAPKVVAPLPATPPPAQAPAAAAATAAPGAPVAGAAGAAALGKAISVSFAPSAQVRIVFLFLLSLLYSCSFLSLGFFNAFITGRTACD